jgi:L-asparaginase
MPSPVLSDTLDTIVASSTATKTSIAVIFTGGTIAVTTKHAGPVPALRGKEILERIPEIKSYLPNVEVDIFDFATLPGPHMSPEMMLTLTDFIRAVGDDADGIVIAHGTDTLEETAFFLDLVTDSSKPIVFTGAMHHSLDAAWDGGKNLIDAVAVASSPLFHNEGILIVMDGAIHAANEVTKAHTIRIDTFRSPDFGPLGSVNILQMSPPEKLRSAKGRFHIELFDDVELPYVELLTTYSGMDDTLFRYSMDNNVSGIVVEAMGQGNVPPGVLNGIARAREKQFPVVITSRCPSGPVRPYYAYEGAGLELQKMGCHFAPYLTGPKARLKLMLLIAAGKVGELSEFFPLT